MSNNTAMSAPKTRATLLIEGSFRELVEELADYIDNLKKQAEGATTLRSELTPLLEKYSSAEESANEDETKSTRDTVLQQLVSNANTLVGAPEREFVAAYNLLIHLISQSPNFNKYLQPICQNLSSDSSASPVRFGLILTVLSTIFNILPSDQQIRFPVFDAILSVIGKSSGYDALRPQLKYLDGWVKQWNIPAQQARRLYTRVSNLAQEAGENEEAYEYQIRALRTISSSDVSGDEARDLSVNALKTALTSPTHFDFEDLATLDSVQALRTSSPVFYDLLEIFTSQLLEDYNSFKNEHSGWVEEQELDDAVLVRKMRLLTIASLAASSGQARSLSYSDIASNLQIPSEDVEMWVIDVIRAGLVEGKLSQLNQTFLIHRSTYRVFTETQWREVAGRLDIWRSSLMGVLQVIRQEKQNIIAQKEQELREANAKVNGMGGGGGYRRQQQRDAIDVGMD